MGCAAVKPAVDRLEAQEMHRMDVVRVNIQDPAGRAAAEQFGLVYTPAFILFDSQGGEVRRFQGPPNEAAIRSYLDETT
jgi:thioredoxin-like negative regulator of GroEL